MTCEINSGYGTSCAWGHQKVVEVASGMGGKVGAWYALIEASEVRSSMSFSFQEDGATIARGELGVLEIESFVCRSSVLRDETGRTIRHLQRRPASQSLRFLTRNNTQSPENYLRTSEELKPH
jgi:hypothetical protein